MRISDWSSDVCSSDLALLRFQKSGKPIIAYGEFYSQTAYYLASVADKIYLHPEGSLDFGGLGSEVIFFTGLLEKLDIVPQVIRSGIYKSAMEPFTEKEMSPASREQMKIGRASCRERV